MTRRRGSRLGRLARAGLAALGEGGLALVRRLGGRSVPYEARAAVTIACPAAAVHEFWRDPRNLPRLFDHVVRVTDLGAGRARWTARAPDGELLTWEAELVEDVPCRRLAWRSLDDDVDAWGEVTFAVAPGARGTEVRALMVYGPAGSRAGSLILPLAGLAEGQTLAGVLLRARQLLETGEVARVEAGPRAPRREDGVVAPAGGPGGAA